MHAFMNISHKDLVTTLNKDWSDEVEQSLKTALTQFNETRTHNA